MKVEIEVRDQGIRELLGELRRKSEDLTEVMETIGTLIFRSVEKNFAAEGRWSVVNSFIGGSRKWDQLKPSTVARRKKMGKGPHPILQVSGGLAASVQTLQVTKDSVVVGTNKEYAAMHQFGAKKGELGTIRARIAEHMRTGKSGTKHKVRAHDRTVQVPWGDVPARPFLVVQEEDLAEIRETILFYLTSPQS